MSLVLLHMCMHALLAHGRITAIIVLHACLIAITEACMHGL